MTKRIFVGIPVPEPIQKSLSAYCHSIATDTLRFTRPENYHITISFFGEQDEQYIEKITEVTRFVLENTHPFAITFNEISYAPPKSEPSMIWAQFYTNGEFTKLVKSLEDELQQVIHFTDKRNGQEPIPHITLARFKSAQLQSLPQITFDPFIVNSAALFESKRTEKGPEYATLETFSLKQ